MNCEDCAHEKVCEGYSNCKEVGLFEPKRPHGEWIFKYDNPLIKMGYWECSICKQGRLMVEENFCPNCGADMRVKDELNRVSKELNSEIEKSKSEIVPDYRDGWRLRGEAE